MLYIVTVVLEKKSLKSPALQNWTPELCFACLPACQPCMPATSIVQPDAKLHSNILLLSSLRCFVSFLFLSPGLFFRSESCNQLLIPCTFSQTIRPNTTWQGRWSAIRTVSWYTPWIYNHTENFVPMFSLSNICIYLLINLLCKPLHIHLPTHPARHTTLQKSANPCIHLYFILYLSILSLL